eukprot:GHVT01097102.1.p1 GENE.GHVT01097102.1~~GHVT01097102.1.p1  ORF type:complete len:795 (-),score=73.28 GHVT01097102.1:738-3122(-)
MATVDTTPVFVLRRADGVKNVVAGLVRVAEAVIGVHDTGGSPKLACTYGTSLNVTGEMTTAPDGAYRELFVGPVNKISSMTFTSRSPKITVELSVTKGNFPPFERDPFAREGVNVSAAESTLANYRQTRERPGHNYTELVAANRLGPNLDDHRFWLVNALYKLALRKSATASGGRLVGDSHTLPFLRPFYGDGHLVEEPPEGGVLNLVNGFNFSDVVGEVFMGHTNWAHTVETWISLPSGVFVPNMDLDDCHAASYLFTSPGPCTGQQFGDALHAVIQANADTMPTFLMYGGHRGDALNHEASFNTSTLLLEDFLVRFVTFLGLEEQMKNALAVVGHGLLWPVPEGAEGYAIYNMPLTILLPRPSSERSKMAYLSFEANVPGSLPGKNLHHGLSRAILIHSMAVSTLFSLGLDTLCEDSSGGNEPLSNNKFNRHCIGSNTNALSRYFHPDVELLRELGRNSFSCASIGMILRDIDLAESDTACICSWPVVIEEAPTDTPCYILTSALDEATMVARMQAQAEAGPGAPIFDNQVEDGRGGYCRAVLYVEGHVVSRSRAAAAAYNLIPQNRVGQALPLELTNHLPEAARNNAPSNLYKLKVRNLLGLATATSQFNRQGHTNGREKHMVPEYIIDPFKCVRETVAVPGLQHLTRSDLMRISLFLRIFYLKLSYRPEDLNADVTAVFTMNQSLETYYGSTVADCRRLTVVETVDDVPPDRPITSELRSFIKETFQALLSLSNFGCPPGLIRTTITATGSLVLPIGSHALSTKIAYSSIMPRWRRPGMSQLFLRGLPTR